MKPLLLLKSLAQRLSSMRKPAQHRPAYAKVPHNQRMLIASVYIAIGIIVVVTLRALGSDIRTRSLPVGSITVTTNYAKYLVGDPVKFTVANNYNSPIYITNTCPSEPLEVYKQDGGTWKRIHDHIDPKDCPATERQIKVPAQSSMSGDYSRWKNLFSAPGTYRVVVHVDYYDSLPYSDFEVIEKPKVPEIPALLPPKSTVSVSSPSSTTNTSSGSSSSQTSTTVQSTPTPSSTPVRQSKTVTLSVGTVQVEYTATTVYVLSVSPASGYSYEGGGSGTSVEITFKKPGQDETQLKLSVRNGQLVQRVETGD